MKSAFTLIEILVATLLLSIVIVVSFQSIHYVNQAHQQNEIRYLALNRLDSEMSRLVMAYKNYTPSSDFIDTDVDGKKVYKRSNGKDAIDDADYGLKISSTSNKRNFVQLKDKGVDNNKVEDGDFIAILNWDVNTTGSDNNISLTLTYPYIYHSDSDYVQVWNGLPEKMNLQTSIKI